MTKFVSVYQGVRSETELDKELKTAQKELDYLIVTSRHGTVSEVFISQLASADSDFLGIPSDKSQTPFSGRTASARNYWTSSSALYIFLF